MLVTVQDGPKTHFVDVSGVGDRSTAQKTAFRFIFKRREKDYQEIVDTTTVRETILVTPELTHFLGEMR